MFNFQPKSFNMLCPFKWHFSPDKPRESHGSFPEAASDLAKEWAALQEAKKHLTLGARNQFHSASSWRSNGNTFGYSCLVVLECWLSYLINWLQTTRKYPGSAATAASAAGAAAAPHLATPKRRRGKNDNKNGENDMANHNGIQS